MLSLSLKKLPWVAEFNFQNNVSFRYFSPWNGLPEDPVNGSSHTVLGPYWASEFGLKPASKMDALVCSPRGGRLRVWLEEEEGKVFLAGSAVVTLKGRITV